jgi:NADH:ubiquinone reductase (H+-translocating)
MTKNDSATDIVRMIDMTGSSTSTVKVVVIGGGFAGLYAARALKRSPVEVTVIDKRNFHLFQPLLYQVATGGLSPGDISSPLRAVLNRQKNTRVIMGEVIDIDVAGKRVVLEGLEVEFDFLIVATGVTHHYFGHADWERFAPGLKTVEDALEIRRRILLAYEAAERVTAKEDLEQWLNFVIVGGGPTGVELAGTLAELAFETIRKDFRNFDPRDSKIFLVEGLERVLPTYPASLSTRAANVLVKKGIRILTESLVTGIEPGLVRITFKGEEKRIPSRTVLWAAGVSASPIGKIIADKTGVELDRVGRIKVEPDLSLKGYSHLFVVGDLAYYAHQGGSPLPGVAPVAMQQGRYVAQLLTRRLRGNSGIAFHYIDKGSLAVIGRNAAVARFGRLEISGFFAWIIWIFVHIAYLIEFDNRLLVLINWAMNYFTRNRGARLISGKYDGLFNPEAELRIEKTCPS